MEEDLMGNMLLTWEEIAGYLRISRRSAQRMEKICDLPVRRKGRGFVYAFKEEIDSWLKGPGEHSDKNE